MNTLANDILELVVFFCNFDKLSILLFVNKNINKLLTPHYNNLKENIKNKKFKYNICCNAIRYEQYILINYLIHLDLTFCNGGLQLCAALNYRKMMDYFILKGANDWNSAMINAVENNHKEIMQYMIFMGAKNFREAILIATKNKYYETIFFLRLHIQ